MNNVKTKEQLEEIIATAQQALADLAKPKSRAWKPKHKEGCFTLYSSGAIFAAVFSDTINHPDLLARGRIAKTREELVKKDRKDVALKRINDAVLEASGDWVVDWRNANQEKYAPNYLHHTECWMELRCGAVQYDFHLLPAPKGVYEKLFMSHAFNAFL